VVGGLAVVRRYVRLLAVLLGVAILAACVQSPALDVRLTWLDVTPAGVVPLALASSESGLVVAGTDSSDSGPSVVLATGETVPLVASEPYAASARIEAATSAGGKLYLIGGRSGGAHGNVRWTVWDGSTAGPVTSRPQDFFTFGGHDAGPLLDTVVVDGKPVIIGSRGGDAGPDAALYVADGEVWHQLDTPSALHSANGVVLGFTAVTAVGSTIVIVGDSVRGTESGAVQTPALFYGTVGGAWHRVDLPVQEEASGLRHATAVACAGSTCWVAGWAQHPVVWQVSLADGQVIETTTLSGDKPGDSDPSALVAIVQGRPLVMTNATTHSAVVRCTTGWSVVTSPGQTPGGAMAVTGSGADAYVVAGDRLWRATVAAC
jgi:hypothetical protein